MHGNMTDFGRLRKVFSSERSIKLLDESENFIGLAVGSIMQSWFHYNMDLGMALVWAALGHSMTQHMLKEVKYCLW